MVDKNQKMCSTLHIHNSAQIPVFLKFFVHHLYILFFCKRSQHFFIAAKCHKQFAHRKQTLILTEIFAKMRKQKVNFILNVTLSVSRISVLSAAWCSASRTMVSPSRLSSSSLSPESQRPPNKSNFKFNNLFGFYSF